MLLGSSHVEHHVHFILGTLVSILLKLFMRALSRYISREALRETILLSRALHFGKDGSLLRTLTNIDAPSYVVRK